MSDALSIAASGLKTEEYFINKLAHDISNLNTNNYKATKIIFSDAFYQTLNPNLWPNDGLPIVMGLGSTITRSSKDFSPGPLKPGTEWNDVAIDGTGFFQILREDGHMAYSRESQLGIDNEHYLATHDGFRLADNIHIPEDFIDIKIEKNGEVKVFLPNEPEPQLLGMIQLAHFNNQEDLEPIGSGLYRANDRSGEPTFDNPGEGGTGLLLQKQIEASNVDMVSSLMELTLAQRIYQLNAKTIKIADELERTINELRD